MSSVNAQAIKFLLDLSPDGFLARTKLVKLVYLADLEARRFMERPITRFNYVWHHFGPWDRAFFDTFSELIDAGYARNQPVYWSMDRVEKRLQNGNPMRLALPPADKAILEFVARRYITASLEEVLDVVYKSQPMKEAQQGDLLSFDGVNGTGRSVGFDLEEVMATEAAMLAGQYKTADEWF